MKRKVIRQGHDTLTVTLPKVWTRRFELKAGDEIEMLDKDNGIFISTEKSVEGRSANIDISKMDVPTIWKYFMGIYREGYDEVKVNFSPGTRLDNPSKFFT